jgi:cephalosporin-C deacetylase
MSRIFGAVLIWLLCSAALCEGQTTAPAEFVVQDSHANGVYRKGEKIHWDVNVLNASVTSLHYILRRGGKVVIAQGDAPVIDQHAAIETSLDVPDTILGTVNAGGSTDPGKDVLIGAAVDPFDIPPSAPPPADFDAFWKTQVDRLKQIPLNPRIESATSDRPAVNYCRFTLDRASSRQHCSRIR